VVILHPPYSPDLASHDFFLFPKMKLKLKGCRFDNFEEMETESQRMLDTLTDNDFQEAVQTWKRLWDRCLQVGGNYFEGDSGRQALW
jgi:histone-lysine N-methyltransferase SETMAR